MLNFADCWNSIDFENLYESEKKIDFVKQIEKENLFDSENKKVIVNSAVDVGVGVSISEWNFSV